MQTWYLLTKLSHWNVELSFLTHIGIATSYISSLMSNSMFERWFSALLVLLLFQKCYGSHCTEMFFECLRKSFFEIFRKFSVYSIQAKMSCSKFQLSARMNRKNLSLDGKMKVIDYANKNPSGMSGDCRTFQYWKDLRLKYLKERKNSSKGIWIFQRKL